MNSASEPSKALISALQRVLRPLVRFMLANGVTLPFLNQLLKQLYVDVAEEHFTLDDKPQSDSRISLLTGVHRKDVRRLRSEEPDNQEIPGAISLGAQIVSNWLSERRYLDSEGHPLVLTVRTKNAKVASFENLVASVSRQDLRPRVVLDELLRLDIVTVDDEDNIMLRQEAFIPPEGSDEQFHYFAQNIRDHISAATHNMSAQKPAMFERAVTYHGLTKDDISALKALSSQLATDALKEVNRRAKQMKKQSAKHPENHHRINFGAYFYSGQEDDER